MPTPIVSIIARAVVSGTILAAASPALSQTVPAPVAAARSWTILDANTGKTLASQEAGLRTRVAKLAALYDRNAHGHTPSVHHSWKAFFLCEVEGGELRGSYETDAVDFFDPFDLPPMSIGRCTPSQVLRMREHWIKPDIPTDFD